MSHYVDTMGYCGEIPWHGLGAAIDGEWASSAEMMKASGLDWTAEKTPVFYTNPVNGEVEAVPSQYTVTRSDRGQSLGCTVGERYTPLQNERVFLLGDAMTMQGEARWLTAGALKGGREVWALAQLPGSFDIRRSDGSTDTTVEFLLFRNTHDGSSNFLCLPTNVRVVCWNTLSWALAAGGAIEQRIFRCPHTARIEDVRAQDVAEALEMAAFAGEEQRETMQSLANEPMDTVAFGTFAAQLLTGKDDPAEATEEADRIVAEGGRKATILQNKAEALGSLFVSGNGNRGSDRFDALNSVTDFIDHQRQRLDDWQALVDRAAQKRAGDAFHSAQFGHGSQVKRRALQLLAA